MSRENKGLGISVKFRRDYETFQFQSFLPDLQRQLGLNFSLCPIPVFYLPV
jgi:hypothetical protein